MDHYGTRSITVHLLSEPQLAQHPGEGGILHFDAFLFGEFFVHPLNPATGLLVEALKQLHIDLFAWEHGPAWAVGLLVR